MSNQVLLARPHPFIVTEMKPFLEGNGYSPVKLEKLSELSKFKSADLCGAIISLAVYSSLEESAEAVYTALRKQLPDLPIVFAGMLDSSLASKAIQHLPHPSSGDTHIISIESGNERQPALGQASTFVYVRNTDLSEADKTKAAAQILKAHFK